jgi:hypothetical protein
MSTNTKLKLFQVSEYDIINMFAYSGSLPVTAGTVVCALSTSGFRTNESNAEVLSWPGVATYRNTVSTLWGTVPKVRDCGSGDTVLGLLRNDVRTVDENGIPLRFYQQKAVENEWTLSGQTSAIVTRGFVFISGGHAGTVQAGAVGYASGAGEIVAGANASTARVGKFWGAPGDQNYALFQIDP